MRGTCLLLLLLCILHQILSKKIALSDGSKKSSTTRTTRAVDSSNHKSIGKSKKSKTQSKKSSSNGDKKSSNSNAFLHSLSRMGEEVAKATRGSFKSTIDLLAGKHVDMKQIVGKWRLSQDIILRKGVSISCPSTFELFKNGTVATTFEDKTYLSTFTFQERTWPRYCTIEFEARAFKGPTDKEPILMHYKGYFKRSILDSKVILMRGKVFRITGRLWKQQNKCGKFKANRRRYR